MPTDIKLKNSVTATNTPTSLQQGEVAINITDKKVWVGNAATTPVLLLGSGSDASFTNISVSDVATFGAGTVSLPSITTTGDTNTGIFFPAADTIAFTEGGVESMRVDSDGKLLIGTTTAGTTGTGITLFDGTQAEMRLQTTSSGTGTLNGIQLALANSDYYQWNFEAGAQIFGTNNAERMRIDATGLVGIGKTPVNGQLDIDAGSNVAFASTNTSLTSQTITCVDAGVSGMNIQYIKDSASPAISDSLVLLRFYGNDSAANTQEYGRITTLITSPTSGSETGQLSFAVVATGSITTKLTVSSNTFAAPEAYNQTSASAANVFVASGGQMFRSTSSIQYKTDVEDLAEPNSANIYNMRPVWYRSTCDKDNKNWSWYGLIAEEVAELDPRLVHWGYANDQYDITYIENEGQQEEVKTLKEDAVLQPEGVQYDRLTVLLIQEMKVLKAEMQELKAKVAALEAA